MERYESYKGSGVEWIGEIPKSWRIVRAKSIFTQRKSKGNTDLTQLSATQDKGMVPQSLLASVVQVSEEADLSQFKTVHKGDFVISLRSFQGGFELSQYEGVCSPAYQVFFGDQLVSTSYFKYLFKCDGFISKMNSLTVGIREGKNIQYQDFANSLIVLPSKLEQKNIADYLDRQTLIIDSLVQKTKKSIELLQEQRKSVISEAVTKGLDPNVPMKDSGVEWIGEIPEGWEIIRLGLVAYIRARIGWRALKAEEYVEAGYPMYSAFNIVDEKFVSTPVNYITEARYLESPEIMIKQGDLMLVKDGAGVGKCALVRKLDHKATVNGSIALISPNQKIDSRYLYYFFESNAFQHFAKMLMGGMGVPHLFQSDIKLMKIVLPLKSFQKDIADYLDQKTSEIDSLINKKKQLVQKLHEYRKSLISECVTGKVKVPGVE